MYDELVRRLREAAEYVPCIMDREDAIKAADAIEELQQQVEHYHGCMNEWFEAAQECKAAYREEHNKRIAENRYLYDELTKAVREKFLMTPMRIEMPQPPKEE